MVRLFPALFLLLCGCQSPQAPCPALSPDPVLLGQLQQDVQALTDPAMAGRRTGTPGAILAATYLQQRLSPLPPWQQDYLHPFQYGPGWAPRQGLNLVAWVPGPPPYRLVVAHYDHLGRHQGQIYPGADDNASGVAVLLALAHRAHQQPLPHGVIFAALDAEENGLHGSQALQQQLAEVPLAWVLNLDMVGRPDRQGHGRLWWRPGWEQGEAGLAQLQQTACLRKGPRRMKGARGSSKDSYDPLKASDHYPFHRAGLPWYYLGVTAHKDYHRTTDKAERLDYPFMTGITEGVWLILSDPDRD
ncbi:M28 family peptidase [Ferrimonas marina]|uniref:Peptidase family M28 n=1 Tax=Ferrimonas marina TaxID=299255 RepID=A0A1M5XYR5_9GAMM|nr:M28 family peptidase [Ferrimonas marina]SHI04957.1 Peptidase family M28 [Ferrimonas marina]